MSSKSFEDRIRERLNEVKIQPRPEVWEQMEARLPKKEKRWPLWGWLMEGGLIVLLAILWLIPNISNQQLKLNSLEIDHTKIASSIDSSSVNSKTSSPNLSKSQSLAARTTTQAEPRLSSKSSKQADSPEPVNSIQHLIPTSSSSKPTTIQRTSNAIIKDSLYNHEFIINNSSPQTSEEISLDSELVRPEIEATSLVKDEVILSQISTQATKMKYSIPSYEPEEKAISPHKLSRWAVNLRHHFSNQVKSVDFLKIQSEDAAVAGVLPRNDTLYSLEQPKRYFHFVLDAEYFFHPRWSVQAGLGWMISERGMVEQQIYPQGTLQDTIILSNAGNIQDLANEIIENTEGTFRSRRITIPLYLNHYMYKGRSALTLSLGGMYSMSMRKTESLSQINSAFRAEVFSPPITNPIPPTPNFYLTQRKHQFHLLGRTLYQHKFTPTLAIYGGPSIRYNLKPEYDSNLITAEQKWQIGLEFGMKWFLGKR